MNLDSHKQERNWFLLIAFLPGDFGNLFEMEDEVLATSAKTLSVVQKFIYFGSQEQGVWVDCDDSKYSTVPVMKFDDDRIADNGLSTCVFANIIIRAHNIDSVKLDLFSNARNIDALSRKFIYMSSNFGERFASNYFEFLGPEFCDGRRRFPIYNDHIVQIKIQKCATLFMDAYVDPFWRYHEVSPICEWQILFI